MGFTKSRQELDRYYAITNRQFIGARMLGVMYETRPEIVARLLPPPLEPADAPAVTIFIAQYPETNLGPGYREAAMLLRCRYAGETGSYCLAMPIESEESRLYNGRDIFGFPKKIARIHLENSATEAAGSVERHGTKFVEVKVKLAAPIPQFPPSGPNFLFKANPRIDLKPGFDGPVLLCRQQTDIVMKPMHIGPAEVTLRPSDADPWAEVEVVKVVTGFYMVSDNTMQPGTVLKEVDGGAYLPYYFKITDFFTGK